tara:strand:+ start:233 stop:1120 length:888 start_codon:yes stop_codon:yes gene_type:complete
MKNFKNLFLSLIVIFICELTFSKIANAAACTATNGVYSESEIKSGCEILPELYEVTIYKIYFCRSEPTTPTTSASVDLTDCFQVFNNDNGSTASTFQNQSINLTGTYFRPPNGTYTHGYAMMDNTFNLKASLEIDGSMDGQAGGSGVFCRTAEASGIYTKGSGAHTNDSICSDTEEAAGTYVETLTHFGTQSEAWQNTSIVNNINGTAASIKGVFVDENGHLAANEGEVDKFEGFTTFANPITINRNTIAITMSFGVGVATSLASAGDDKIYMGVGPFSAIFTATQRARRRGGWR